MPHPSFTHLRVHSAYSLAEGTIKIPDLAAACKKHQMSAVALTDSNNLFGALNFSETLKKAGVQPLVGCQLSIVPFFQPEQTRSSASSSVAQTPDCITVLAQNQQGYLNLMKLLSQGWLATKSHGAFYLTYPDLFAHAPGLLMLTGGTTGGLARCLLAGNQAAAQSHLKDLRAAFSHRLYIEITRLGTPQEAAIADKLIDLAYQHDIPLVATNPAYFLEAKKFEAHDALQCIASGRYVSEVDRPRYTPDFRFKSAAEMADLFADLPEAIQNTDVIRQRCAFMVEGRAPLLPRFPSERTEDEELAHQARAGLESRLARHVFQSDMPQEQRDQERVVYESRLTHELKIISQMGFAGYFLIVADFIKWAKEQNIPVGPGRGSGAGALTAWVLTITDVDPIRMQLIFERFLNPQRLSMPDFDIDFCQDRRDEVIAYVCERYGADRVAQIITFGKLQAKAVIRDVGRVLQMPYGQVDRISKMIPGTAAHPATLSEALEKEPELRQMQASDETVKKLIHIGLDLEGLFRHASTHAAGVVISDRPLNELVALYQDPRAPLPATQFNMKDVEKAGLVKFDFLGLKTLTVIAKAAALASTADTPLVIEDIPLDDEKTFELLRNCFTVGIFQIESQGMTDVLRRLRPHRFEELIALVSLYRPGPMDDIPRYLACRHGEQPVDYLHPMLEGILKETFGVMVYQEQVMQIAQLMAGYTAGDADLLRRAMGKKVKSEMDEQSAIFVAGAQKNGVDAHVAQDIFDRMAKFASYGFNKSHAAPYALLSYQTAYLKAHYPVEFYAANMTYEMAHVEKLDIFRQDMTQLSVNLLPPDINCSFPDFHVEHNAQGNKSVRYALAAIKNIGEAAMTSIVSERQAGGPFADVWDFAARVDSKSLNKRSLEHLIAAGAFDSLNNNNRKQLYEGVERILSYAQSASQERTSTQSSLFATTEKCALPAPTLPHTPDWTLSDRLEYEMQAVGYYLTSHPLASYREDFENLGVTPVAHLAGRTPEGAEQVFKVAGTVLSKKERFSKKGQKFAFVRLSDHTSSYEVVFFAEPLQTYRSLLEPGALLLLDVSARREEDAVKLIALSVCPLNTTVAQSIAQLCIDVPDHQALQEAVRLLQACPEGTCHIQLRLHIGSHALLMQLPQRYRIDPDIRQMLRALSDT